MPKGVPALASSRPEIGQKVGGWYFHGAGVLEPPGEQGTGWPRWPDGSVAVKVLLGRGPGYMGPPGSKRGAPGPDTPPASLSGQPRTMPTEWAQLEVRWQNLGDPHPLSVALVSLPAFLGNGEGAAVGPKMLARFPWATWLTVADAAARSLFAADPEPLELMYAPGGADGTNLRRRVNRQATAPAKHPGRAGHDDEHYLGVAERYRELRLQGSTRPTKDLADAYGVTRNTAAGWVRIAREKGFLAPARRGRPGG